MTLPVVLVANSPDCDGQPAVRAVARGTTEPAKLIFSAPLQMQGLGRKLHVGETLRAAARRIPSEESLLPPPGLALEVDAAKVIAAGRTVSPSPPSSDTATPKSTSDLESASSEASDTGDECEGIGERGLDRRQQHKWTQQGPPGLFCTANAGPMSSP